MGKHLAQKEIKDRARKAEIEPLSTVDNINEKKLGDVKVPNFPVYLTTIIAGIILLIIPFFALEEWMTIAAYAVAFLLAALELIWALMDNLQDKKYFAVENIALLSGFIAFAIGNTVILTV